MAERHLPARYGRQAGSRCRAGLNAPLVSLMLGIGIPLSLITVPAWWYALAAI